MSLWFWAPLAGSFLCGTAYGVAAFKYAKLETYPRKVRAAGLKGIVRETAKFTLLGSGAGFITDILTNALEHYVQQALFAILIVSAVATFLNFILSAATDNRTVDDGEAVHLDGPLWLVVHGLVYGLTLGAILSLVVLICVFGFDFAREG